MKYLNSTSHDSNEWQVPPGRYSAILTHVSSRSNEAVRLIFKLPEQWMLKESKKAAKHYVTKQPHWLEKDLRSWLGSDRLQKLAMDGMLSPEQLNNLIGIQAVLVITNENHGKKDPLTVISEILPYTPENLKRVNAGEPLFRMSFAPNTDDHAMAA